MTRDRLPVRTTRIPDDIWDKAKGRAEKEKATMSQVVVALVNGYATGAFNLPKLVYTPTGALDLPKLVYTPTRATSKRNK